MLRAEAVAVLKFRSALLHAGYRCIKTNASAAMLWDILRCWHQRHPVKEDRMLDGKPLKAILSKLCTQQYNFDDLCPEANPNSRRNALSRFRTNRTAHWGPGTRATIMVGDDKIAKSFRNQNKNQKLKPEATITATTDKPLEAVDGDDEGSVQCEQPKLCV